MKRFATISFFLVFILLTTNVFAIQYYGIDSIVDEKGKIFVKLTITFKSPEDIFSFNIIGRVENFNATTVSGPIDCNVTVSGITTVDCYIGLTEEKRTVNIYFETTDFVKSLDNKFNFNGDFSLNRDIDQVFASVKLPEVMALVSEEIVGRLSYPKNATILSDGRHIIVVWEFSGFKSDQPMRFQILYERLTQPGFQLRLSHVALFAFVSVTTLALLYIRFFRKPEKLILSVLDEFERKVIDIVVASGGEIIQKKVVQQTNLSKSKVSRVVKSLVERGLIEVERMGRRNKLKIVKKKFKI